jgi:hypothetical protein
MEKWISLSSVVIALSALGFAISEGRSNQSFQKLSVQPSVTIFFNWDEKNAGWYITNRGLGPAIVKSFRGISDGAEIQHPLNIAKYYELENVYLWTTPSPGTWFEAGQRDPLLTFARNTESAEKLISGLREKIRFEMCYCSIYKECWLFTENTYAEPEHC